MGICGSAFICFCDPEITIAPGLNNSYFLTSGFLNVLGPLCYKLITIVNYYVETGLS